MATSQASITAKMEIPQVYYIGNIRVENYAPGQHIFARLAAHLVLAAIEAEESALTAQSLPETTAQEVAPTAEGPIGAGRQAT